MPGFAHQECVGRVCESVRLVGECVRVPGVAIQFEGGAMKGPDVSIFGGRPEHDEGFVRMVPEAVVEITRPGYEEKDLVSGPPLHLANGVRDVMVFERATGMVHHWTAAGSRVAMSPVTIELLCGCRIAVEDRSMNWREYIVMTPGVRSGKPRLKGSRLTVQDVLEYLAGGMGFEELQEDFPELDRERIQACLAFAADRERMIAFG